MKILARQFEGWQNVFVSFILRKFTRIFGHLKIIVIKLEQVYILSDNVFKILRCKECTPWSATVMISKMHLSQHLGTMQYFLSLLQLTDYITDNQR